jgi:uncharacterized membrane protein
MPGTLDTQTLAQTSPKTHRRLGVTLGAIQFAGVAFVVLAALPYLALDQSQFAGYWPRRWWLLLHVATGIVALLSGPVQLWLGITDARPALHRRLGLTYVTSVAVSAAAAYYLALNTDFGWAFGAGLAGLATAWVITTGLAFVAIRRHLYDQHKEWMIRSYVVTTAFVSFRLLLPVLQATGAGTLNEQLAMASWVSWAMPLLVTEAVLQGRQILAST